MATVACKKKNKPDANLSLDKRVWDHCEAQERNLNPLSIFVFRNAWKADMPCVNGKVKKGPIFLISHGLIGTLYLLTQRKKWD